MCSIQSMFRALLLVVFLVAAAGCGQNSPSQPDGNVTVTVTPSPTVLQRGTAVTITVTAVPTAGLSVDYTIMDVSGVMSAHDSIPGTGGGQQTFTRGYVIPSRIHPGDLVFTATAHAGSVTGAGTFKATFADTIPPDIASFTVSPDSAVLPGSLVKASFTASDDYGLRQATLSWSGSMEGADTVLFQYDQWASHTFSVMVPEGTSMGGSLDFELKVTDAGGTSVTASHGPIRITDAVPPAVSGTLSPPSSGMAYQPGEQLGITLNSTDNVDLAWVGYRMAGASGPIRDSVAVSGPQVDTSFATTIGSWNGTSSVRVFARDPTGNLSQSTLGGVLVLGAAESPSIDTLTLEANIQDVAVDEVNGVLYALLPDSNRVARVSLTDATRTGTIDLPWRPTRLDVAPDGAWLAVTMRDADALAVISDPATSPTLQVVPVGSADPTEGPDRVRITANGKAIISITFLGTGFGGSIDEYDLNTGTITPRTDVGGVTESTPMARAFDGSTILVLRDGVCCPEEARIYDAETDVFGVLKGVISWSSPPVSADYAGSRFLVRNLLFDRNLDPAGSYSPAAYDVTWPTALGPAGFAAFATGDGVAVVRLSDGAVVDNVSLNFLPGLLRTLADGHRLIATGGPQLDIVTLW